MPVTFQQIASNTAKVTVQIPNLGPVIIEYYPNKMTDKYVADLQAGNVDDNTLLIDLIKSWDIYEDADFTVMFPIERMDEFGYAFKVHVAMAIVNDLRPEAMAPQSMNGHN
jgi:hypothetical protein